MAYIEDSNYPTSVDDLVFVSDVDIAHIGVMQTHQDYINNNQYSTASTYLREQDDITPVNAGLFNLIENRIVTTQEYLLTLTPVVRCMYGSEPTSPLDGTIWVE